MSWFLTKLLSALLLPPLSLLIVAGCGFYLWHKRPRLARFLLGGAIVSLWLLSTPWVAQSLLQRLEGAPAAPAGEADAIVVLGGGVYFHAPEYAQDTVNRETLERLRYAARLERATGKPILVSGGKPQGTHAEAQLMKRVLEEDFRVPVRWLEESSEDTFDNARHSRIVLDQAGIRRIYLVTHAWHMPRARQAFEAAGFTVVPAATAYTTRYRTDLLTFVPNARAMLDSYWYLHEIIGMFWYRLKS